jgi:hypothetical protein
MSPMGGGWWQNLDEASINGRQVLVKRYKGREGRKEGMCLVCTCRSCSPRSLFQRKRDDLAFLKSVWCAHLALHSTSQLLLTFASRDARFPQLCGISQQTNANPEFIVIHNGKKTCSPPLSLTPFVVGITDLRAFITPFLRQGHILEVAAIATRIVSSR